MNFAIPTDEGAFSDLIESITSGIDDVRDGLDDCVAAFNANKGDISLWQKFLDWFTSNMEEVREKLQEAVDKFSEFIETIAEYLSPGNPFGLLKKFDNWVEVKKSLTESKTHIETSYLKANSSWKGDLGEQYGPLIDRQHLAIDTLVSYSDYMADFLNEYATSILDTWIEFGETLVGYILDQIDAGAAFITADPLEWLDIVPKIVQLCTNLGRVGVDLTGQLASRFNESREQAGDLKRKMADLHGLPSGSWPAAAMG